MTVAIPTPNTAAARRRDRPRSTARTTRSRKSREYGRAMHAGPLPSMQLESQFHARRNPLSRLDQPGYRSRGAPAGGLTEAQKVVRSKDGMGTTASGASSPLAR